MIIAGRMKYTDEEMFKVSEEDTKDVEVKF